LILFCVVQFDGLVHKELVMFEKVQFGFYKNFTYLATVNYRSLILLGTKWLIKKNSFGSKHVTGAQNLYTSSIRSEPFTNYVQFFF
jgi:hypothetical protein